MAASTNQPVVLLALETFATELDGQVHIIRVGDRRVSTDAVAVAHPSHFREKLATD